MLVVAHKGRTERDFKFEAEVKGCSYSVLNVRGDVRWAYAAVLFWQEDVPAGVWVWLWR
jgi:hypothetical protein